MMGELEGRYEQVEIIQGVLLGWSVIKRDRTSSSSLFFCYAINYNRNLLSIEYCDA